MKLCKMCYKDKDDFRCSMNDKNIGENDYTSYCKKGNTEKCPVYQYYYKEYKRLTEKR